MSDDRHPWFGNRKAIVWKSYTGKAKNIRSAFNPKIEAFPHPRVHEYRVRWSRWEAIVTVDGNPYAKVRCTPIISVDESTVQPSWCVHMNGDLIARCPSPAMAMIVENAILRSMDFEVLGSE